jgi:hypothetical protein
MDHEGVPMDSEGRSMMPRPQGRGNPQVVRSRPFADGKAFNFSLPLGAALPYYWGNLRLVGSPPGCQWPGPGRDSARESRDWPGTGKHTHTQS